MENADTPARIDEAESETPYSKTGAMEFIEDAGDRLWCLHLSYMKPRWPYIVPARYHDMYGPDDVLPAVRPEIERRDPHRVLAAPSSLAPRRPSPARRSARMIPAHMGLITQIDDHIGRLLAWMDARGISQDTLIVFTSDHGDCLGDHWLGEKELFYEQSGRVPKIVVDHSPAADATRGGGDWVFPCF